MMMNSLEQMKDVFVRFRAGGVDEGYQRKEPIYALSDPEDASSDEGEVYKDDSNASQLLMYPKQKTKIKIHRGRSVIHRFIWPCIYLITFLSSFTALVCLILYVANVYSNDNKIIENEWRYEDFELSGCSDIQVEKIWTFRVKNIFANTPLFMIDVNDDSINDVLFGFVAGDGILKGKAYCDVFFNGSYPCQGGILALDGKTGNELWRMYSSYIISHLNCDADLNGDGIYDCIGGGDGEDNLQAYNSKNGKTLWHKERFKSEIDINLENFHRATIISDINDDDIPDILAAHIGHIGKVNKRSGFISIFSGKDGVILRSESIGDGHFFHFAPMLYNQSDSQTVILFCAGKPGGTLTLKTISISNFLKDGFKKVNKLFEDREKEFMNLPILIDITDDGIDDIVFSASNLKFVALNGKDYQQIWIVEFPFSDSFMSPAAGFYNNDSIPDFLVQWHSTDSTQNSSQITIIDGKKGQTIASSYLNSTYGSEISPLPLNMEGKGFDLFIYWTADCINYSEDMPLHEFSHGNLCDMQFKATQYSHVNIIGSNLPIYGITIYESKNNTNLEGVASKYMEENVASILKENPQLLVNYKLMYKVNTSQPSLQQVLTGKIGNSLQSIHSLANGVNEHQISSRKHPMEDIRYGNYYHNNHAALADNPSFHKNVGRKTYNGNLQNLQKQYVSLHNNKNYDSSQYPQQHNGYKPQYPTYRKEQLNTNQQNNDIPPYAYQSRNPVNYPLYEDMENNPYNPYNQNYERKPIENYYYHDSQPISEIGDNIPNYRDSPIPSNVNNEEYRLPYDSVKNRNQYLQGGASFPKRQKRASQLENDARYLRNKKNVDYSESEMLNIPHRKLHTVFTGSLSSPLLPKNHPDFPHTMDVLLSTNWKDPLKIDMYSNDVKECIRKKLKNSEEYQDLTSVYFGLDSRSFIGKLTQECLFDNPGSQQEFEKNKAFILPHTGHLSIHRLRLKCTCGDPVQLKAEGKKCTEFLPYNQQQFANNMGY